MREGADCPRAWFLIRTRLLASPADAPPIAPGAPKVPELPWQASWLTPACRLLDRGSSCLPEEVGAKRKHLKPHHFRSIYWPGRAGQRSNLTWYFNSLDGTFYMLIYFQADLEDLGGHKPNFGGTIAWDHSTPPWCFIRIYSKLFDLLCWKTH